MVEKNKSLDEDTWIAMIGLVASTLVVFVLVFILIAPLDTDVDINVEKKVLYVHLEKIKKNHFISRDFRHFKNIDSVPKNLINYLSSEINQSKKYTIKLRFLADKRFSKGTNYDRVYGIGKTAIQMLIKAGIPIENIRLRIVEDDKVETEVLEIFQESKPSHSN